MTDEDENHLGTDEESSKESSLQSSLQDSSLTELEGKMASSNIGAGGFRETMAFFLYTQTLVCSESSVSVYNITMAFIIM